ncbi:MotA/TolQ/ExbB proton channel family protein [bacterium]|mgnify:CR=1 FL=1|jgi:biopolymer transport protein ExbB|nr:MotA/TolQ/ExbB proton channel family protein [bacterium]
MFTIFAKGGPVMWLLLLCSIGGLTIVIQKWLMMKSNPLTQRELDDAGTLMASVGRDATMRDLLNNGKVSGQVLGRAISLSGQPKDVVQDGIDSILDREIPKMEKQMDILGSIITVAPILGLLGTVLGLMDIFNVISGGGIGDAQQLSGGIAVALITTVTGLSIAMPFIFAQNVLHNQIDQRARRMESMAIAMIRYCQKVAEQG